MLTIEKEWNRKEIHSGNWVLVWNTFFMSSCCQGLGHALDNTVHWITWKSIVQSFKVIIIKWSIGWLWCICNILSDGMSRTGVFIAAMCEVERVKVEGEVDFFQTIKAMRKKRPHMVYNKVWNHRNPHMPTQLCNSLLLHAKLSLFSCNSLHHMTYSTQTFCVIIRIVKCMYLWHTYSNCNN